MRSASTSDPAAFGAAFDRAPQDTAAIEIGLNAAIVAVERLQPLILVVEAGRTPNDSLPFGPFDPLRHRTLESGLRAWVEAQTDLKLGYVEQLYTFGDRGRHAEPEDREPRVVSVGYLALTRRSAESDEMLKRSGACWRPWYGYFPWEDWREGRPALIDATILPQLEEWSAAATESDAPLRPIGRLDRVRLAFGCGDIPWDEERVLDRFELLYEAGLIDEARRDGRSAALRRKKLPDLGIAMRHDHRRILATAVSRLRGKLKYRPVVFELLAAAFTLTELQHTVEAISGRHLHKQNFRRLVEQGHLVEPTGSASTATGGRPAALFRFRREVRAGAPGPRLAARGALMRETSAPRIPLIFIRHGETDWNIDYRFQGRRDIEMNALGRRQAARNGRTVAGLLANGDYRLIASPLSRAVETMRIVLAEAGTPTRRFETDPVLVEANYGDWEGLTLGDIAKRFPRQARERERDKWGYVPPNGESYKMVAVRVAAWLKTLRGPTCIVAHGGILRALLFLLAGLPAEDAPHYPVPQDRVILFTEQKVYAI